MQRREFITLLGGAAAAWPLAARAQQPAMPVIGFLNSGSPEATARVRAFRQGLSETGYVEGQQRGDRISLGGRPKRSTAGDGGRSGSSAGDRDRHRRHACGTGGQGGDHDDSDRLHRCRPTRSRLGLVASLNRPGGNVTGVTTLNVELAPKRLELLHELVPAATIDGPARQPDQSQCSPRPNRETAGAARTLGLQLHVLHASTERDFDSAFASLVQLRAGALVIGSDIFFTSRSEQLAALAVRHAVPTIYQFREFAAAGGLMSYGGSITDRVSSGRRLHRPDSRG